MKKLLFLISVLQVIPNFANLPTNNQHPLNITINDPTAHSTRGLIGDLQTAITNFPQTLSSVLPTVSNIQKLLLSGAIIGLGYQCCKYGLSKYNRATKLRSKSDDSEKGKQKFIQSKWFTLTGSGFILAGACMLLCAQRIANCAYRQ